MIKVDANLIRLVVRKADDGKIKNSLKSKSVCPPLPPVNKVKSGVGNFLIQGLDVMIV